VIRLLVAVAGVLAAAPVAAREFDPDFAQRGALVRVTLPSERFEGRLLAQDAESLRVSPSGGGEVRALELSGVNRLEVRTEQDDGSLLGMRIGFVAGTLLGLFWADRCDCMTDEFQFVTWGLANGAAGAGVGAAIGSFSHTNAWEDVPSVHVQVRF